MGWSAQLVLASPAGKPLWQGPRAATLGGPFPFQGGPAGETDLQVAGPFERAGQGEVVVKEMQSDVRVEHFRVLRWNGRALISCAPPAWSRRPPARVDFSGGADQTPRSRWISGIRRILGPGRCEVDIATPAGEGWPARGVVAHDGTGV